MIVILIFIVAVMLIIVICLLLIIHSIMLPHVFQHCFIYKQGTFRVKMTRRKIR